MKQCLTEQAERYSPGLYQMEGFYRKEGGVRELLAKEKEGLILDQTSFFLLSLGLGGNGKGFIQHMVSSSPEESRGAL